MLLSVTCCKYLEPRSPWSGTVDRDRALCSQEEIAHSFRAQAVSPHLGIKDKIRTRDVLSDITGRRGTKRQHLEAKGRRSDVPGWCDGIVRSALDVLAQLDALGVVLYFAPLALADRQAKPAPMATARPVHQADLVRARTEGCFDRPPPEHP